MTRLALRLIAVMLCVAMMGGCNAADGKPLPTPMWQQPAAVNVRADAANGLLLRQVGGAIYRWQIGRQLSLVGESVWLAADTPVADCSRQMPAVAVRFNEGRASLRGVTLVLSGPRAENAYLSHSANRAAVLSSSRARGSVAPFLGSGSKPPFFIDFLDIEQGRVGPHPVRLPFANQVAALAACWTVDDRHLVVHDIVLTGLVVLPTSPEELPR